MISGAVPALAGALIAPPRLDAGNASLFLDLDGTLAPIAPTPSAVQPDRARTALLRRLAGALEGRVAVLSGRAIADVDRILGGAVTAVAGVHGLERRRGDSVLLGTTPAEGLSAAYDAFSALARAQKGLVVEHKGLGVALHYRQRPESDEAVRELAARLAMALRLTLQEGDMVAELRTPGPDKGDALAAFMAEQPFSLGVPIMIGDDLTDEAAFIAAEALGGAGVLVGSDRETAARWRLDDVQAVLDWLSQAVEDEAPWAG